MSVQLAKRLFSVKEYYRMAEAGILGEDDRVELIHGEIIEMSPIGSAHLACVNRLNTLITEQVQYNGIVSIQNPVGIDDFSEPEPDVAILKYREDYYEHKKPMPEDVLLLIEVADSSIERDKKIKIPLYAFAKIEEVWLVDLKGKRIIVYTQPFEETYRHTEQYFLGDKVVSKSLKQLSLAVSEIIYTK